MTTKELTDLHKEVFATWRFQIESYWTRNSYFAGFQTAAVVGIVTVSQNHHWTGLFAAMAALVLAVIWFLSCDRQHEYQKFWWEKLIELDTAAFEAWQAGPKIDGVRPVLLAADFERWRRVRDKRASWRRYQYSMMMLAIIGVFIFVWFGVIGYNVGMLDKMGLWPHLPKYQVDTRGVIARIKQLLG